VANIVSSTDPECVPYAAQLLRAGGLVCYPTDTVYGIGAVATNDEAVRRLYAVKGRSPDKPLPLLVANSFEAMEIADIPPIANQLITRFWPGALTIVFNKLPTFHSAALAKQQTVALRVPDHDLVIDLIHAIRQPITGTSANRAGARAPVSAAEVGFGFGEMVALVIDGGRTPGGKESTVVDVSEGAPRIVRDGAVSRADIEECLGRPFKDND
jgi:L-threonylcarbamoyladenylate synthase